jgi:hypothetical protein
MLITKLLNNLMNNVEFGEKESYMTSLNPFISPDNLLLVQQFMQELVVLCLHHPSSHAIARFRSDRTRTRTTAHAPPHTHNRGQSEESIIAAAAEANQVHSQRGSCDNAEFSERYRLLAALDEIKRSLLQLLPALYASAATKPKLVLARSFEGFVGCCVKVLF